MSHTASHFHAQKSAKATCSLAWAFAFTLAALLPAVAQAQDDGIQTQIDRIDSWIVLAEAANNKDGAECLRRDRATWVSLKEATEHNDAFRMLGLIGALKNPCEYIPPGAEALEPQPPPAQVGPEILGQVYAMPAPGSYLMLEREEGDRTSAGGWYVGYSARTKSIRVEGTRSTVRFPKGLHPFVVKVWPGTDPYDEVKLYRFEVREGKQDRVAETSKSSSSRYHSHRTDMTANRVHATFEKIDGPGVYRIVTKELPPGEYGFLSGQKVFAFAIEE